MKFLKDWITNISLKPETERTMEFAWRMECLHVYKVLTCYKLLFPLNGKNERGTLQKHPLVM